MYRGEKMVLRQWEMAREMGEGMLGGPVGQRLGFLASPKNNLVTFFFLWKHFSDIVTNIS